MRGRTAGVGVAAAMVLAATALSAVFFALPSGGAMPAAGVYRWGVVGNRGKIAQLERSRPTKVAGINGRVVEVATSNSDGYALTAAGAVYAWGVNTYGELGNGTESAYATRATRVTFPAGTTIASLPDPMPFDAGLAIDSSGHVWGWGLDWEHALCLPSVIEPRPRRIALDDVTLASGAKTHALFDSDGTVYSCGSGDAGDLGDGSTATAATPTPVTGLPPGVPVAALTSSWEGSGALLADGAYYDWGYGTAGQLGDGANANSAVPVHVPLPGPVRQVFQGGSGPANGQTIALLRDGTVWAWGSNGRGQLGDGSRVNADTPVKVRVPKGVTVVAVSSGGFASYAIDGRGELWAWGDNRNGQLGTGGRPQRALVPVAVGIRLAGVSSTAQNVVGLASS